MANTGSSAAGQLAVHHPTWKKETAPKKKVLTLGGRWDSLWKLAQENPRRQSRNTSLLAIRPEVRKEGMEASRKACKPDQVEDGQGALNHLSTTVAFNSSRSPRKRGEVDAEGSPGKDADHGRGLKPSFLQEPRCQS